ncbi:FxSxx-COOH protein [Streptomyces sp. NBC_01281]|uniref:FxSxx-COOH cyclophane-containing RiPP peptide n=1 Tax=unclassified Streptomyces TaxID=2593676 RepID=UPI002252166C|nr:MULTISPECIES: FxSxx-COOH cyclophane-containing RiPP peptide [unclassified Streptomyces]MCX5279074.1 FxSxx-COOH protein [Streptomyces sp. NBC_00198]WSK61199.1 FxSxx-COOH protein [Streptomyces sp. NBC_01281]
MGVRDEARDADVTGDGPAGPAGPAGWSGPPEPWGAGELPDLLDLDLAGLRAVRHPVLDEVLADLRERAARPSEILWGFNNSF